MEDKKAQIHTQKTSFPIGIWSRKAQIPTMKTRDFQASIWSRKAQIPTMKTRDFQASIWSRKAQIHMMETIAILLIFFLIMIIVFVFFIRAASFSQEDRVIKAQELQSIRVSQIVSFLPEFQCSTKNIIQDNCFDKYKIDAFMSISETEKNRLYYPFFYFSEISVKQTYPAGGEWLLYNRTLNGTSYLTAIPILLRNVSSKQNSFGLLKVRYYTIG